jgi:hypothetical protein
VKAFHITVTRPAKNQKEREDEWSRRREALVISESFDAATNLAIKHYNDIDGVDDYFVRDVDVTASTEEGEGGILLM